ncbi:hypothetical protein CKO44_03885 [Rubrivivax gelatinosus]|uniref:Uncharacterized protein n=1 Tax=Rubrivivax gelatinosus TaxID=28068 RepID=A0ABS1DS73_RUBGE|nr:hypothetical protein [Rubrivivax gelatinosus]MBK1612604.1 hypothetical protein [Rubrivivax gelatinosus]MBK1711647.1 hypothetical protein [Rubrivivax gelatinosus]
MPALFSHRRRRNGSPDWPASPGEAAAAGTRAGAACGWYESSLELMQGLAVTEHAELDEFGAPEWPQALSQPSRNPGDAG